MLPGPWSCCHTAMIAETVRAPGSADSIVHGSRDPTLPRLLPDRVCALTLLWVLPGGHDSLRAAATVSESWLAVCVAASWYSLLSSVTPGEQSTCGVGTTLSPTTHMLSGSECTCSQTPSTAAPHNSRPPIKLALLCVVSKDAFIYHLAPQEALLDSGESLYVLGRENPCSHDSHSRRRRQRVFHYTDSS